MEQHSSVSRAFFQKHKDFFQYDKYITSQDPFQDDNSHVHADGGVAMTSAFLERYCQLDRERPPVPPVSEIRVSQSHSPKRRFSMANPPVPAFVTLQSTSALKNLQHDPIRSYTCESQQRTTQQNQLQTALSVTNPHNSPVAPQYPNPIRGFTSKAVPDLPFVIQQQHSPVRQSLQSVPKGFSFPQLSGLLIDRKTRAAALAHKSWDEAHKIEVLIGSKCVGRVSAASRNIPQSVRSRLQASANVSVRRERLYDLLRRDYEELSKRITQ